MLTHKDQKRSYSREVVEKVVQCLHAVNITSSDLVPASSAEAVVSVLSVL